MADWSPPWPFLMPALLGGALATALPVGAPRAQERLPDLRTFVPIDRVAATVNDTVILHSDVVTLSSSEVRVDEAEKGRKLTQQELERILARSLNSLIERAALAQAAKTLGVLPPDRVEEYIQQSLREDENSQMREL